jgi:hypothetical protein
MEWKERDMLQNAVTAAVTRREKEKGTRGGKKRIQYGIGTKERHKNIKWKKEQGRKRKREHSVSNSKREEKIDPKTKITFETEKTGRQEREGCVRGSEEGKKIQIERGKTWKEKC